MKPTKVTKLDKPFEDEEVANVVLDDEPEDYEVDNKIKNVRRLMYVNQLEHSQFKDAESLQKALEENFKAEDGYEWAFINHNKCVDSYTGKSVEPHWHIIIQNKDHIELKKLKEVLEDKEGAHYEYLKSKFKASELYIIHDTERCKRARKHLYDVEEVTANYDYQSRIDSYRQERHSSHLETRSEIEALTIDIVQGRFSSKEELYAQEEYQALCIRHSSKIAKAFEIKEAIDRDFFRQEKIGSYDNCIHLDKPRDEKKVIWIYGQSGKGKSLLSRLLAKSYSDNYDEIFFANGANDPFQNYDKERIMVIDELRKGVLDTRTLLQLLDRDLDVVPPTRYHNPTVVSDVIIINTILPPETFFFKQIAGFNRNDVEAQKEENGDNKIEISPGLLKVYENNYDEPFEQLRRRISEVYEVKSIDLLLKRIEFEQRSYFYDRYQFSNDFVYYNRKMKTLTAHLSDDMRSITALDESISMVGAPMIFDIPDVIVKEDTKKELHTTHNSDPEEEYDDDLEF